MISKCHWKITFPGAPLPPSQAGRRAQKSSAQNWERPDPNTIDIAATVQFASSEEQPVYTRYRKLPSGRWVNAPIVKVDNPTNSEKVMLDYTVTGLLAGTDYEIEVDAVPDFSRRHIRTFTTQPPTASGVHVHQKSQREVQVKVSTKDINDGVTIYTRYRSGSSQWLHLRPVDTRSGHVFQFPLGGLALDNEYELQASSTVISLRRRPGPRRSKRFGCPPPASPSKRSV